jgi:hypothetical protein
MKRLLPLICLLCASSFVAGAQSVATVTGGAFPSAYTWPAVTAAGVSSTSIYTVNADGAPSSFTIDEATTGTAPTTCAFEVESSPDGVTWNSGAGSLSGSIDCHSAGLVTTSFISKPVRYLRINVTALTGGDGTTRVTFSYTRGQTR